MVYEPIHVATQDRFHIPPEGMAELMNTLRKHDLFLVAQVHSHPAEAFHSIADDKWAIPRRAGALSIVLPYFAAKTTLESFLTDAAIYKLSPTARWDRVLVHDVEEAIEIIL